MCKISSAKFAKQPKIRQKFGSFGANLEFRLTAAKFRSGKRKAPKALIYKDFGAFTLEVPPRFELGIEVLQTFALPLGYGTTLLNYARYTKMIPKKWSG